jgi:hypothetical protein
MSLKFAKQNRFYHVYLQGNLFGGITAICSWGAFDSKRGGYKYVFCASKQEADLSLCNIANIRLKRGYIPY